jgi:predicted dehydrogenase
MSGACRDLKTLNVLIVGCGNIAGGFDQERTPDDFPYTHAGAYTRDGRFNLAGCVEPDVSRRAEFMQQWLVPEGYADISGLASHVGRYDVISICSPTSEHYLDVKSAIVLKPKLIFCEKPVTPSALQTAELVECCKVAGVVLVVNYTRRWDADVMRLRDELRAGVWGAIRSVTGVYTKGILNNGSHMIDLLHMLFGKLEVRSVGKPVLDLSPDDPTIPAFLECMNNINVQISCGHAQDFSLFELLIVTGKGVICMEDGGLNWRVRSAIESPHFRGYRSLDAGECKSGALPAATLAAVTEIHAALMQGGSISSTGENALAAQQICEVIRNMAGV